jgi:putative transposase
VRREKYKIGDIYHIYNRGVKKNDIFLNESDWDRFLTSMFILQYRKVKKDKMHLSSLIKEIIKSGEFNYKPTSSSKDISINAFCLMPNHFHLIIKIERKKGLSKFMKRLQSSHSQFYNKKYGTTGHVFESPYKTNMIESYLEYSQVVNYIHRNPLKIQYTSNTLIEFKYSSLFDHVVENRWGKHLNLKM